jgi:hypothetical protein
MARIKTWRSHQPTASYSLSMTFSKDIVSVYDQSEPDAVDETRSYNLVTVTVNLL